MARRAVPTGLGGPPHGGPQLWRLHLRPGLCRDRLQPRRGLGAPVGGSAHCVGSRTDPDPPNQGGSRRTVPHAACAAGLGGGGRGLIRALRIRVAGPLAGSGAAVVAPLGVAPVVLVHLRTAPPFPPHQPNLPPPEPTRPARPRLTVTLHNPPVPIRPVAGEWGWHNPSPPPPPSLAQCRHCSAHGHCAPALRGGAAPLRAARRIAAVAREGLWGAWAASVRRFPAQEVERGGSIRSLSSSVLVPYPAIASKLGAHARVPSHARTQTEERLGSICPISI